MSLGTELGFSLQFPKLDVGDLAALQEFDLPHHIAALDASLSAKLTGNDAENLEYQFKVVYTLTSASKSKAHFQFVQPDTIEGKEIQNVLIKYKPSSELYPLKPGEATKLIAQQSGRPFTSDKHSRAWKMYKARPKSDAKNPGQTDARFCFYHEPYKSYTYSNEWIKHIVAEISDDGTWDALVNFET